MKKFFAAVLCFVMCLAMFPVTAFAENAVVAEEVVVVEPAEEQAASFNDYAETWYQFSNGKYKLQDDNGNWYVNKWFNSWRYGAWFYFGSDGYMVTGWKQISGKWYYFNNGGYMQTGWVKVSGKWYYMDSSGAMQTGWVKVNGTWYYMDSSGVMKTGWVKSGGKWYYMESSGAMKTGWLQSSGKWYWLDESSGEMVVDTLVEINKTQKSYYFGSDGVMVTNQWIYFTWPDGAGSYWYHFGADGALDGIG